MAQTFWPCQLSGTKGAGGAWMSSSHTESSRGASVVIARYARRILSARSNGQAISPP